ncbi:nucleotidyltransferase domain-containing protein [Nitrobacter winogradskyi]|uniref:Nucleotidyltransferase n=2 Tax=Nitrobacter winogradskyi TaxID=913 RepID=A0ACC6AGX3_NITWI|nr:nucleotidyltransferase domain-containing protein [Nitrobacter winogradskyi]MCP1998639.1 putative nucleotidyltransferase [Nitrobacter winogradskyi]GEC15576.1 hypothetical protein NWI01_14680 [Nitrobacter winogradskyi]
MRELERRRSETASRLANLRVKLEAAEEMVSGKACVYTTGSFGRGDASPYSDLDLFIVGRLDDDKEEEPTSALKRLDDVLVRADLVRATRDLKIPDFDGDGKYLVHYSIADLTKTLGHPEDDVTNTFTARLLLLLESSPLLGRSVYESITRDVIARYWQDFSDHEASFIPGFLANDILRLWRTFCVNYEVRTASTSVEKKAKRKVKNFKLKHSRLLTCFSALLFLLNVFRLNKTVRSEDAVEMIKLSPTQRLEKIAGMHADMSVQSCVSKLLDQYDAFLEMTNHSELELVSIFQDGVRYQPYKERGHAFGNTMFNAVNLVGDGSLFHRILTV